MVGHRYTQEEHDFLKAFIPGHTYKEIVAEWNSRFDEPITETRVKGYMANHKINNGLTGRFKKGNVPYNKGKHTKTVGRMAETQFKKGGLPPNTKPIGYERVTKDGYIEVKVMERPNRETGEKNFKPKHRLIWEQAYGPIPKGHNVIFKDGNKRNFELSNLELITNAENLEMMRKGLRSENPQLTETGILIARSYVASQKAKKKEKSKGANNNGKKDCK